MYLFYRVVGLRVQECMNMNLVINRRVKLKQVVPWYPYACHFVVLCPVQLCKRKYSKFFLSHKIKEETFFVILSRLIYIVYIIIVNLLYLFF